ncbi:MAG: proteasome subunit alpha [Nitrospirota bacterium]|nr:proteasome subunit alpha [Nitrospirota bacterium]
MYEEPYRWVEAVVNRRQYLNEQFRQGSPVVALSYAEGALLITVSRGMPKLYEVYDRIALGGMGHPADLEKLRFSLLEMAHLEGFNRSPADVTAGRLMKYGLAPVVKQAFEEVYKAPFIVKILLVELGLKPGRDSFLTVDYDGSFDEATGSAVLAATSTVRERMVAYLKHAGSVRSASLEQALEQALKAWAVGSLAQQMEPDEEPGEGQKEGPESAPPASDGQPPGDPTLFAHLREVLAERTIECIVLERNLPGSSKYRAVTQDDLTQLLPPTLRPAS